MLVWLCVEEREDIHALRRVLDFEVEGQRKKMRPNRTWKKQVEEESVKVGLRRKDARCRSKWIVRINLIAKLCSGEYGLLTCWGYFRISNINLSLSARHYFSNFNLISKSPNLIPVRQIYVIHEISANMLKLNDNKAKLMLVT